MVQIADRIVLADHPDEIRPISGASGRQVAEGENNEEGGKVMGLHHAEVDTEDRRTISSRPANLRLHPRPVSRLCAVTDSRPALDSQISKAAVLIEALPYMQAFRGQTFLIKVGGSAMDDQQLVKNLLRDIVFLEAVGISPVVVHGGGKAISAAMAEAGLEPEFVGGLRVTSEKAISIVEETLSKVINPGIVDAINSHGGRALGIPGHEVFRAERLMGEDPDTGEAVDLGFVGKVRYSEPNAILDALSQDTVPVVSPVAKDVASGDHLNVNADLAASALACHLRAAKLIYLSDVAGVLRDKDDPTTLISSITDKETETLINEGIVAGGMIPKVRSAAEALHQGVGKVHLIDGRVPHSLILEVFTDSGIGTEIFVDS